jgi:hypothetical protein
MDGKKDLVIGSGNGDVIIYNNSGTDSSPVFASGINILSAIGNYVSAFVVDWNNDSRKDLIVGDKTGYVDLWLNSGTDLKPGFDTAITLDPIKVVGSAIPFVIDWNNDFKKDLLIGDGDGKLNLYLNTGTDQAPLFNSVPDSIPVNLGIGHAAPFVITDWDRDGDKDLIIGDIEGYLNLYLNTGTDDSPTFTTGTHIQITGQDLCLGSYSKPFVLDWDNDGMKDLVIGNANGYLFLYLASAYTPPPVPPAGLTASAKSGKVGLEWHPVDGAVSYSIYRGDSGTKPIALSITTVYVDYKVVDGTTYTYTVTALNGSGKESAKSAPVSATPTRERKKR